MAKVFKIAKPGYNAKDAADENLIFSGEFDSLKAKTVGTLTVTITAATPTDAFGYYIIDIPHLLAYTPEFFVLYKSATGVWNMLPYGAIVKTYGTGVFVPPADGINEIRVFSNATNLSIRVNASTVPITLDFKYYIFYNQLD